MKAKLLKKLRSIGRNQITVYEEERTDGIITGMSYGYNDRSYRGLFEIGNTEEEVKEKACKIYLKENIYSIRSKYKKYSIKNKEGDKC